MMLKPLSHMSGLISFLERGEGRGKGKEKHSMCERNMDQLPLTHPELGAWPATQAHALTGNRTSNLLVRRPAINPLSHTNQDSS